VPLEQLLPKLGDKCWLRTGVIIDKSGRSERFSGHDVGHYDDFLSS